MNETLKTVAVIVFFATYALLLAFPGKRAHIAVASAAVFIATGIMPLEKVFVTINWNVLLMIAGTMGTVSLFIESKMPSLLGDIIIAKTKNTKWATIALSLFAGLISAFIDNVATLLMVAPVAMTIAKKLEISPVSTIIAIAISSNLQGAATLVGDTTSILLGGQAGLNFLDFFVYQGKIGIFWVVQAAAIISALVLLIVFRKDNHPISTDSRAAVADYFPTILLVGTVVLLILVSFIPASKRPEITNGLICVILFMIGLIRSCLKEKKAAVIKAALKDIDAFTLILLAGLFLLIGGINEAGVVEDISKFVIHISGDNIFAVYTLIVWFSVFVSAFIDNIPYVATMLPVVAGIAGILDVSPSLLYFGLLSGATLGGNLTPIGASANITALGILRKDGYKVRSIDFMKISVPFTLSAVAIGYVLIWLIWK